MTSVRQLRDALLAWLAGRATTAPASIYRALLPYESSPTTVRQHPAILLGPFALAFGGLAAASLISAVGTNGTIQLVIWIIWAILLAHLVLRAADWLESFFAITSIRIILVSGSLQRKVDTIPLDVLNEITFKRSLLGRFLGYASFTVTSRAPNQITQKIDFVPNPEDLYATITDAVFLPRKVPCPECHGEGALWMPSGQEPIAVLKDENSDVDIALRSGQDFKELLEAGFEKVKCSVCDGQGVVSRDSDQ
jgi:uncharacterized membrane protein YdbT with pleckstrin-like domain